MSQIFFLTFRIFFSVPTRFRTLCPNTEPRRQPDPSRQKTEFRNSESEEHSLIHSEKMCFPKTRWRNQISFENLHQKSAFAKRFFLFIIRNSNTMTRILKNKNNLKMFPYQRKFIYKLGNIILRLVFYHRLAL
jgi:hypothetical protein